MRRLQALCVACACCILRPHQPSLLPALCRPRGAFFVAKSLTTTPVEVAQVSLFTVILYFMFGWQPSLAKFLVALVCLNLFALVSESLGYLVGRMRSSLAGC